MMHSALSNHRHHRFVDSHCQSRCIQIGHSVAKHRESHWLPVEWAKDLLCAEPCQRAAVDGQFLASNKC